MAEGSDGLEYTDGLDGGPSSKKKKSGSRGGTLTDSAESGGGSKRGGSVCPSTRRNRDNIAEPPSCAPRTFDPSSVPSASGHKAARRNGTPSKSTIKKSRSGKGSGSGSGSSGNGGSLGYSDYYGSASKSKSGGGSVTRSKSGKAIKKPGSVCPPTVLDSGAKGSGGGGGPFDCNTTMDPFDCETIFDCDTTSKKTATKFAVSEKPIPKVYNPSTSSKSRMLYLDSETTDSTHLRAYERGSAQKNPIAKPVKTPTSMKKKSKPHLKPMSIAPTTTMASESTGFNVPSTKVPQHGGPHTKSTHRSKHSKTTGISTSIYNSTDCSCSECINSCDYDYTMSKSSCQYSSSKHSSNAPTSYDFDCGTSEVPKPKKTCKSSTAKSSGGSTCKKSSSKKSIHSEGGKSGKSSGSCKKSSSKKEDGKENQPSNGKKSSGGSCKKSSSGKSAKSGGSSCKRSKSKDSIKSPPKVALPPSCKPPSKGGSSDDYETPPTLHSSCLDSSVKPSSCPPSEEKPNPTKLKSCCPSSEKKTATRYTSGHHRRRKSRDLTTDYTWSDTEETESKHHRHHKSTKVTTRHMTARYEDGKLVDKKMKEKKTSKKYKPTADTTTFDSATSPSSLYTSSYFMDSTRDGTDDKTSSKHSRHRSHSKHREDKSLRRSRSERDIQAVRYKSSESTRHHDDDSRKKHGTSELRRTISSS